MPAPQNFKTRPGSKKVREFYRPRCAVCQYMKKNPVFRSRILQSSYFSPTGTETLARVIYDFGEPFPLSSVYQHMSRHQQSDLMKIRKRYSPKTQQIVMHPQDINNPDTTTPLANAALIVTKIESDVESKSEHELALDEFVRTGREKMLRGEMNMTATNYLAAIKIKSDNEKNTKDRRMDMIKSFFTGGGQGNGQK